MSQLIPPVSKKMMHVKTASGNFQTAAF